MTDALHIAVPTASCEQLSAAHDALVIDLRSPAEFALDHVPGARNEPLFGDVERALIGTLYKRDSPQAAFEEARRRVLERIESLVAAIAAAARWNAPSTAVRDSVECIAQGGITAVERALAPEPCVALPAHPVVLYCWRGGLRSRSVVALLRRLGLDRAVALAGGYKGYRKATLERLEGWRAPRAFVLRGLTGVGKTLVLRELERLRPLWTVDLEALAGHRSSVLGRVGLEPCSQKTFESRLAARLAQGFSGPVVFEGESRKVGDVIIPRRVWAALDQGESLELVAPRERRVQVLIDDYLAHPDSRGELEPEIAFIEQRLGAHEGQGKLVELLRAHRERELTAILLERYYDPLYRHSEQGRVYTARIDATDPAAAASAVAEWIERRVR